MKKRTNRNFEDRMHKKVTRSGERRERKSKRHQTKDFFHGLVGGYVDKDKINDMMEEIDDTEWSY